MDINKKGALSDITVLDMTRVLSGPIAAMWLGEMGANVIKIELPGQGDDLRRNPVFVNDISAYFVTVNRNKRGITLDLKSSEGKEIFKKLVKKADIVIENFRPGVMERLGLGYDELKKVNERIIYASISGFGSEGPYADRPAYDIIAQAMGGIMSVTGELGGEAIKVGCSVADISSGMNSMIGILAALHYRTITGVGQKVEVAMADTIIAFQQSENMRYFAAGQTTPRTGNRYPGNCPFGTYKAKDGIFVIGAGNNTFFERLCRNVIKKPEYAEDERFGSIADRVAHREEIRELLEGWAADYTVDEVVEKLLAQGIPAGPIMSIAEISKDPHFVEARQMFPTMEQPGIGEMRVNGVPIKLSESELAIQRPAPMLGEHNDEIYGELLGMTADEITALKEKGTI